MDQDWQQLSEQISDGCQRMAPSPSQATLREIEDAVHKRLSRLEAQVIEDAAQQSERRDWSGAKPRERPTCPVCGTPLQARGKRTRRLQAVEDKRSA